MNDYIIREGNNLDADLIIDRLVEYNLSIVPLKQDVSFLWINRVVENENGEIIAGILSKCTVGIVCILMLCGLKRNIETRS